MSMFNEIEIDCPKCKVVQKYEQFIVHECLKVNKDIDLKEENERLLKKVELQ